MEGERERQRLIEWLKSLVRSVLLAPLVAAALSDAASYTTSSS